MLKHAEIINLSFSCLLLDALNFIIVVIIWELFGGLEAFHGRFADDFLVWTALRLTAPEVRLGIIMVVMINGHFQFVLPVIQCFRPALSG